MGSARRVTAQEFRLIRKSEYNFSDSPNAFDLLGFLDEQAALVSALEDFVGYVAAAPTANGEQVYIASGTIATAAVKTLNATPVTVIAAPGAGFWIDVIDCHWFLDFGTAAYDAAAAGDTLGLKYTNASGPQILDVVAGNAIGAAAADYHAFVKALTEILITAASNAAVVAHVDATEWFGAAGDSPLKYRIRYRIRPFLT